MSFDRRVCGIILALAVAGCAGERAPQTAGHGGGWTQFRLNPQHNAVLPGALRVAWRLETHGAFSSSPSIAGTTVYAGNNKGTLYAIDVRTGHPRWTFHAKAPLMSNPLIYQGLVIVGEGDQRYFFRGPNHRFVVGSRDNALIAVDAKSGKERWSVPLQGSGMPTPAVVDDLLVEHNGGGYLVALRPESGEKVYQTDALSSAAMSAVTPLGDGNVALAGGLADAVQSREVATGKLLWATPFRNGWGMSDCPPSSDGELLFCNHNAPPPGVTESWHPLASAVEQGWAIDAHSGHVRWVVTLERGFVPPEPARSIGSNQAAIPLVVGHTVYFGASINSYVHALATENGRILWRLRAHGPVKGGLCEDQGILYFGDYAGYLWAVDARTGKAIGSKNMHASFNVGSPVIDGQTLVIGSKTGSIVAVPLDVIRSSHDR